MKKDLMLIDNCTKTDYCYYRISLDDFENQRELKALKNRFDIMISLIEKEVPGLEKDYEQLENHYSIIEYIGLGSLLKELHSKNKEQIASFFVSDAELEALIKSHLVLDNAGDYKINENGECIIKDEETLISTLDEKFNNTIELLNAFFIENINIEYLLENAARKLTKFRCHSNVEGIETTIKRWMESVRVEGKNSVYFKDLCAWLSFDVLFRYEWKVNDQVKNIILHLLLGYYLGSRKIINIAGVILFGKCVNEEIVRISQELLDPWILEFLIMGWLNIHSGKRMPVFVITSEQDFENKLRHAIKGALILKNKAQKSSLLSDRRFEFIPGTLIIVGAENDINRKPRIIIIADIIKEIETNKSK